MVSIANPSLVTVERRPEALARFAWLTVIYNLAVILWGAYVRATGSGAGCGGHWPLCNGAVIPREPHLQTMIEFLHRITSGAALLMMAALVVWCWRTTSRRDWPRYSTIVSTLLLLNEAALGALLVVLNHVGLDESRGRAVFLCLHFANTLLLLAALSLTAKWLSNGVRHLAVTRKSREWLVVTLGLASVIATGVTGSLAALGDTLFPATSLRLAIIEDFSSSSHALLHLRLLHPLVAALGLLYALWLVKTLSSRPESSQILTLLLGVTLIAQAVLGSLNVILLAPVWLQITHLLGADLLWIFLVLASADLLFVKRNVDVRRADVTLRT